VIPAGQEQRRPPSQTTASKATPQQTKSALVVTMRGDAVACRDSRAARSAKKRPRDSWQSFMCEASAMKSLLTYSLLTESSWAERRLTASACGVDMVQAPGGWSPALPGAMPCGVKTHPRVHPRSAPSDSTGRPVGAVRQRGLRDRCCRIFCRAA